MSQFSRIIGIDYSGAETPTSSLKGLRVYVASGTVPPVEVPSPPSNKKYWTRRGLAEWLVATLSEDIPTIVGIDHAYVDFVRYGVLGNGAARSGNARWRRLTEERARGAKSVFHFDVQGSVAKSTHSGIPWLLFIRKQLGERVHFWPFDGWAVPAGRSAIVEVYPALLSREFAMGDRTGDQHDAYSIAAKLSQADQDGTLEQMLNPGLSEPERVVAGVEGWILGVLGQRA